MKIKSNNPSVIEENKDNIVINNDVNNQSKDNFLSAMQRKTNVVVQSIQEKVRLGEISVEDLSDEEYEELVELYEQQISQMSNELEKYRMQIEKVRRG